MTHDPRYLVPETSLPFFPAGGPNVWLDDQGQPTTWPTLHSVAHLDLSAPPLRDGIPERLDALPWALAVLARRVGIAIDDVDAIRAMGRIGVETWDVHGFGGRRVTILRCGAPGWEPYDDGDPDQPRRIIAAALRNTPNPKEAP